MKKHYHLKILFYLSIFIFSTSNIFCSVSLKELEQTFITDKEYIIWLKNGDMFSGTILGFVELTDPELSSINFETLFGTFRIYEDEIKKIILAEKRISGNHRTFIMPTANPIENNHFIGSYELLSFYGGFGISNWLSVTAGHTLLPSFPSNSNTLTNNSVEGNSQIALVNCKFSLPKVKFSDSTSVNFALGANLSWLNAQNKMLHIFALSTYNTQDASNVSLCLFYKAGFSEYPMLVNLLNTSFTVNHSDGTFAIGASADIKFSSRKDLSFIGEIWNGNIMHPTHSAILLGLRLSGRNFSSDFGLVFATQKFFLPVVNFVLSF